MSERRYLVVDAEAAEAAAVLVRAFSFPGSVAAKVICTSLTPAPEGGARAYVPCAACEAMARQVIR